MNTKINRYLSGDRISWKGDCSVFNAKPEMSRNVQSYCKCQVKVVYPEKVTVAGTFLSYDNGRLSCVYGGEGLGKSPLLGMLY